MKSVLLICLCSVAVYTVAVAADEQTFVRSALPIYVNGQRVDPREGGHVVSLNRETGVFVDDVQYLPVSKFPPYVRPTRADGISYALDMAHRAANTPLQAGKGRAEAKHAMLEFWKREYGDSLKVRERGTFEFDVTYRGETIITSVPDLNGYHPEHQLADNFEACRSAYREIVRVVQRGHLLLCGDTYYVYIDAADAQEAMRELSHVAERAQSTTLYRSRLVVYSSQEILDDKYELPGPAVRDLVAQQKH